MYRTDSSGHPAAENPAGPAGTGRHRVRRITAAVAATTTIAGIALFGAQSANAATTTGSTGTVSQAVGNFLDATVSGQPIDSIAKLAYASAKSPGDTSTQNPLDVTALNAINLPLTGALSLPQLGGIDIGAVTQKAQAKADGSSYGQVGAALNQGGAEIGGSNPADRAGQATVQADASTLAGNSPIPIPGVGSFKALGSVGLSVGAVSAVAETPKGSGTSATTGYNIANLKLTIASPLLGQLLSTLTSSLNPSTVTAALETALGSGAGGTLNATLSGLLGLAGGSGLPGLPALPGITNAGATITACTAGLLGGTLPTIDLADGSITVSPTTGSISVDLGALLDSLGLNLNQLPANTDVVAYLLSYLANPNGLASGIESVIASVVSTVQTQLTNCLNALNGSSVLSGLSPLLTTLDGALTAGQSALTGAVNNLLGSVSGLAGGTGSPLKPLADSLAKLIDIGANVQENGPAGPAAAPFTSGLAATAKQGTAVVSGQTVVRALEINIAAGSGAALPGLDTLSLPRLSGVAQGFFSAAPAAGILTLGMANAAAGPSALAAVASSSSSAAPTEAAPTGDVGNGTNVAAGAVLPTAVSAGQGTHGAPIAPLVLLALGLGMAGATGIAWKVRGRHSA